MKHLFGVDSAIQGLDLVFVLTCLVYLLGPGQVVPVGEPLSLIPPWNPLVMFGQVRSLGVPLGMVQTVKGPHMTLECHPLDGPCHADASCIYYARTAMDDWETVFCQLVSDCYVHVMWPWQKPESIPVHLNPDKLYYLGQAPPVPVQSVRPSQTRFDPLSR